MSNLSDLLPAGGGQNNTDFVADGAIASGKPVILTAAGKAAEVDEASTSVSDDFLAGSAAGGTEGATNEGASVAWDSSDSDKYVYAFSDVSDSRKLKAFVATVSGTGGSTSISLSTVVVIDSGSDSPNTILIASSSLIVESILAVSRTLHPSNRSL